MNVVSLDRLTAKHFADLVHTAFQVLVESNVTVPLELTAITMHSPAGSEFESFSLLFDGPNDRPLGQQTYRFAHERLGAFDLFIVPVSAAGNARQYEAVFNRRAPSANI